MAGEVLEREVAAMPWQYGVELAAIAAAYLLVYVVSIQFRHPAAEKLPLRKRQAYDNALISGVHSLISSILVVMCLCGSPIWDEFLLGCSPFLRFTLIHTVAYLCYDTLTFLWFPRDLFMLVHHLAIIICFGLGGYMRVYVAIQVFSMIAEVNSFFLHLRKVLVLRGDRGWCLTLATAGLAWSYFPLRIAPHVYCVYKIVVLKEEFLEHWHFVTAFVGMLTINILNWWFLWQFVKHTNVFGGERPAKSARSASTADGAAKQD